MPAPARPQAKVDAINQQRKKAGQWLRTQREQADLSQRELAKAIGYDYYTFISQIESGRGKLPTERYPEYAKALGVPARKFAMTMLRFNDPQLYEMLFSADDMIDIEPDLGEMERRLKQLEEKLLEK